jgi:hypothetical protein
MNLSSVSEVWEVLREHIDFNDRREAADSLVTYLIENNFEIDDIKDEFRDKDITKALKDYADEHFQEEEYEDYEEDEYQDEEWD